jgi:hypothetical protein
VVRTSYGSGPSQTFTNDALWLHNTIERMIWHPPLPIQVPLLPDPLTAIRAMV